MVSDVLVMVRSHKPNLRASQPRYGIVRVQHDVTDFQAPSPAQTSQVIHDDAVGDGSGKKAKEEGDISKNQHAL
ncbi:MAG: hypothetical protein Q9226_006924, partial [Calogaya cf. arnoldii]